MKIGFDVRALQSGFKAHKGRGIGVYTKSLADRIYLKPDNLFVTPFHDPGYEKPDIKSTEYSFGPISARLRPCLKEYFNQRYLLRHVTGRSIAKTSVDAMFYPAHLDAPVGLSVPYIVTAHDMIYSAMRDTHYRSFKHKLHIDMQIRILRNASLIIAISEHTKMDVIRYADCDPDKITVVHNGVDPEFKPGVNMNFDRFVLPEKFILNVGGIDRRKNMELLFGSFMELLKVDPDFHLVMTGDIESDPMYTKFVQSLRKSGLDSKVIAPGYVTKNELIGLYNRTTVFVYPSLYEGFGLPVLEAMACGAPVLTTNRSSIPEIAGDSALLIDPDDQLSFSSALVKLATSQQERDKLIVAGFERANMFSWEKCATETWQAISRLFDISAVTTH